MSIAGYFARHEEQAFIAKALATAVGIILVKNYLPGLVSFLIFIFPVAFLIGIRLHAASTGVDAMDLLREHITLLPMMRSEEERRTEVKPWVTYGIVLANVLVFYLLEQNVSPEFLSNKLIFLPHEPDLLTVPLSAFTALFLHGSGGHLWGNMTFLWVVGSAVERRVGGKTFSWLYLLTGLIGGLAFVAAEFLATGGAGHGLGASGAIAGIMGVFAVRCYFKSMVFPLPILGIFSLILPVSLKIRLNSLVIMAIFFLLDLSGGLAQLTGESASMIGHWAHLGGMIAGMLIAAHLKLGEDAVGERHLEIGMKAAQSGEEVERGERSLQIALEHAPENADALLGLARLKTRPQATPEGRELYEQTLRVMMRERPAEVVEVFREYAAAYRSVPPDPVLLSRLLEILRQAGEVKLGILCLENLIKIEGTPSAAREKWLFQLATLLELDGCDEAARWHFARFAAEYPASLLAGKAREKARGEVYVPPRPAREAMPTEAPAPVVAPAVGQPAPAPGGYRLVFAGDIAISADIEQTKQGLAALFRCDRERIETLFGGRRTVLKKGLDLQNALALKRKFEQTGAICRLEEEEAPPAPLRRAAPAPSSETAPIPVAPAPPAAPPPPRDDFACPKCGYLQERKESCDKCGAYFAKLARRLEREAASYAEHRPAGAPQAAMTEKQERRWAMWCHLLALSGILVPFGNILGPLGVWLWKRKESEFVDYHGKIALNYQLSFTLFIVGCAMVAAFTGIMGMILGPLLGLLGIYSLLMIAASAVKARRGDLAEIGLSAVFIK